MKSAAISRVEINARGQLHIVPVGCEFPYIYREAMEVNWATATRSLFSPVPREWSYVDWYRQILSAARKQGVQLTPDAATEWAGIDPDLRAQMLLASSGVA